MGAAGYVYYSATASQGVLDVTTYPEGARIYIDGGEVGISPDRITGVQLGLREISVGKEGYETFSRLFQFNPGSHRELIVYLSDRDIQIGPTFERIATTSGGSLSHGDNLYLPTTDGRIFSVNKRSKQEDWEINIEQETFLLNPLIEHGQIFISSFYGPIYSISPEDGSIFWRTSIPERLVQFVLGDEGLLGLTFRSNLIYLDFEGNIIWETDLNRDFVAGSLFFNNDQAFVLSRNGTMNSISLATGEITEIESSAIGETLKLNQNNSYLVAVGKENKILLWEKDNGTGKIQELNFPRLDKIFLSSSLLMLTNNEGEIKAREIETGIEIWRRQIYTPVSTFSFFENNLYFGTHEGSVFIIEKATGEVLGKRNLPVSSRITSISTDDDPNLLHVTNRGGVITTFFLPTY